MHEETLSKNTAIVLEKIAEIAKPFYLAGGTSLALQMGHRISVDLDFFTPDSFSTSDLVEKLKAIGKLKVDDQSERTLNGSLDGVKISFFKYKYKLIFPTIEHKGVNLADEKDIAAMKIVAISDRGTKKDFVDLYVLLKKYSLEKILEFFNEKYKECNYNMIHISRSLTYFFDADKNIEPEMLIKYDWNEMKKYITNIIDQYMKF